MSSLASDVEFLGAEEEADDGSISALGLISSRATAGVDEAGFAITVSTDASTTGCFDFRDPDSWRLLTLNIVPVRNVKEHVKNV